jgi:predicted  nucleic acid-binding Zn-ribbon protein
MEDVKFIVSHIDNLKKRERQFLSDIDRLKREEHQDRGQIAQKEEYLAQVRREIYTWENKLK